MLKMSRVAYILLTLVGSLIWNTALIGIGWILGEEWEKVSDVVGAVGTPLLIVVLLILGAISVVWWWRRHPRRRLD
jgi:membrane protein DedA with SNARE-associated domain